MRTAAAADGRWGPLEAAWDTLDDDCWTDWGESASAFGRPNRRHARAVAILMLPYDSKHWHQIRDSRGRYNDTRGDDCQERHDQRLRDAGCPVVNGRADPAHFASWNAALGRFERWKSERGLTTLGD